MKEDSLAHQANINCTWQQQWGQFVESHRVNSKLSDESWHQYVMTAVKGSMKIILRPKVRLADLLPYQIQTSSARVSEFGGLWAKHQNLTLELRPHATLRSVSSSGHRLLPASVAAIPNPVIAPFDFIERGPTAITIKPNVLEQMPEEERKSSTKWMSKCSSHTTPMAPWSSRRNWLLKRLLSSSIPSSTQQH